MRLYNIVAALWICILRTFCRCHEGKSHAGSVSWWTWKKPSKVSSPALSRKRFFASSKSHGTRGRWRSSPPVRHAEWLRRDFQCSKDGGAEFRPLFDWSQQRWNYSSRIAATPPQRTESCSLDSRAEGAVAKSLNVVVYYSVPSYDSSSA